MRRIIVVGIGTEVGKTVTCAILATLYQGDYWKPIESGAGSQSDTQQMKQLLDTSKHHIFPSAYTFSKPVSPHHAARLENRLILKSHCKPPLTKRHLIIEGVGGIYTPLRLDLLSIDLFSSFSAEWIVVSKHYLGSINHTLLTIEALQRRHINLRGLIFNGLPDEDAETAILRTTRLPFLSRIFPEPTITISTIQQYAKQWTHIL